MVGEDGSEPHGPRMQDGLMAQAAKTSMPMDNLDAFADGDVSEDGKEGEDGWEGRLAVDDEEGDIVDLEAVGQVAYARTASIGVCYDNDLVSTVDEFLALGGWVSPRKGLLAARVLTLDSWYMWLSTPPAFHKRPSFSRQSHVSPG